MEDGKTVISPPEEVSELSTDDAEVNNEKDNNNVLDVGKGDGTPSPAIITRTTTRIKGRQSIEEHPDDTAKKSLSPKIPKSPASPESKKVYGELKKRYLMQQQQINEMKKERDDLNGKVSKYAAERDTWREKFETEEKEKEDLRELVTAFRTQNKHLLAQCTELKGQKQAEIRLTRRISDEEFKIKSKSKKAKTNEEELKCEFPSCVSKDEDAMIKCNSCGKWICETCSEAKISRLKPIMNSCSSIFFACKTCIESSKVTGLTIGNTTSPTKNITSQDGTAVSTNSDLISSFKAVLEDTVSQMENKLGSMIDDKLKDVLPIETTEENGEILTLNRGESYAAKVLKVPEQVRKIIENSKNDDKVEENEQERRSRNIIIHGADEYGNTPEEIKKLDTEYVIDILNHLGMSHRPESVTRLGNGTSKKRPIKLIMKTKNDKAKVMNNLSKLKGTIDEFGRISVTDDYTQTEREMLKRWNDDAKAKSQNDDRYNYKVRGDPKNGLRFVRLSKT